MPEVPFDKERFDRTGFLFPNDIETDLWIAFHGTSGQFANSIEVDGLIWREAVYSRRDVETVISLFEALDWSGRDQSGLLVLSTFTRGDFGRSDSKPIYLADNGWRSCLYAQRDWAGGETARALRAALADLHWYHENWDQGSAINRSQFGFADFMSSTLTVPSLANRDALLEALKGLVECRQACRALYYDHSFGLVYAVRFEAADVPKMAFPNAIEARFPIPATRLLAKARIPSELIRSPFTPLETMNRMMRFRSEASGLGHRLSAKS